MGFLDLLRLRRWPNSVSIVQRQLFEAVRKQDDRSLMHLVNKYDEIIRHEFPTWSTLPLDIRGHPRWEPWYMNGLIGVAEFYRRCGMSALVDGLVGADVDNPMLRWGKVIQDAQAALEADRPVEVVDLLQPLVEEIGACRGTGVDVHLPVALGTLGAAYHKCGHKARALEFTRRAAVRCRENGDAKGGEIYERNLIEIERAP